MKKICDFPLFFIIIEFDKFSLISGRRAKETHNLETCKSLWRFVFFSLPERKLAFQLTFCLFLVSLFPLDSYYISKINLSGLFLTFFYYIFFIY